MSIEVIYKLIIAKKVFLADNVRLETSSSKKTLSHVRYFSFANAGFLTFSYKKTQHSYNSKPMSEPLGSEKKGFGNIGYFEKNRQNTLTSYITKQC